jgi:hypothetical protein
MMVSGQIEDDGVSPELSSPILKTSAVFKKLGGDSHTVLVRASDGFFYIVKMMDSFRGPNVLANKALGNLLANYLGLSVPAWRPIEFSDTCMDRYFLLHGTGSESSLDRPGPGLYLGTRAMVQDDPEAVLKELPENWLGRIDNRNEFAGMLLLDLWANQVGQRKAIFVLAPGAAAVTAVFTGNSQMFGGFWGREEQRRGVAPFHDRRIYAGLDVNRAFSWWLQKAVAMDEEILLRLARAVPRQWHDSGYLQAVASQLQTRKWSVAQLLDEEMTLIAKGTNEGAPLIGMPSKRSNGGNGADGDCCKLPAGN